jgi:hypothetical protein
LLYHTAFFKTKEERKKSKKVKSKGFVKVSISEKIFIFVELPFKKAFYNKFEICKLLASWRILFSNLIPIFENKDYFYLRIVLKVAHANSLIAMFLKMDRMMDTVFDIQHGFPFKRNFINVILPTSPNI